jgi:hypothetical protein
MKSVATHLSTGYTFKCPAQKLSSIDKTAAKLVLLDVSTRLVLVQAGIASSHVVGGDGRCNRPANETNADLNLS